MKIKPFFDLLFFKTACNLRAEVTRLYLNYIWWTIEPMLSLAVFYIVFGIFMNSPTPHFGLFILIGTTQWQWFGATIIHASSSIANASGIISKVNINKVFFPIEVFLQDSFKHLFVLALFAIFLIFYPVPVTICWVSLPLILFLQAELILACSIFFAAVVPLLPDLKFVIPTFINILFFVSGIFFDVDQFILPKHRPIFLLNPMATFLHEYRRIIITGLWPDWEYLSYAGFCSTFILFLALCLIHHFNPFFPRLCQQ